MTTLVAVTDVPAPSTAVWQRIVTGEGINHELMPVMRMTVPAQFQGLTIEQASQLNSQTEIGRSYLLLLGFLPFDYDNIVITEVEAGRRFVEQSTMVSMRSWRHERVTSWPTAAVGRCRG